MTNNNNENNSCTNKVIEQLSKLANRHETVVRPALGYNHNVNQHY